MFQRERNPNRSKEFCFSRCLVHWLIDYRGWAIVMGCDMRCRGNIAELCDQRDDRSTVMCMHHEYVPAKSVKFLGAV